MREPWNAQNDRDRGDRSRHLEPVEAWPAEGNTGYSAVRSTRWWPLLLVGLVAVVVVAVVLHPRTPLAAPKPTPVPLPTASTALTTARTAPSHRPAPLALLTDPPPTTPGTVDLGHPILGVTAGWDLFGRGMDSVVRIELAKGRLTRTAVPSLRSSGSVSFLAGPDRAIIRPLDFVPGFAVRDGHNAADLAGALDNGGPVLPGPDAGHIWADTATNGQPDVMTLIDWEGHPTPTHFKVPTNSSAVSATSDGAGNVLLPAQDGSTYQVRPDRIKLLTTGNLLAVGPTGYLVSECTTGTKCVTSVVDRTTNKRRILAKSIAAGGGATGLISPDGQTAAVIDVAKLGSPAGLSLVNLLSGVELSAPANVGTPMRDSSSMVWSPDSRWLFVANQAGRVAALDPSTGQVENLGLRLPRIEQLAIRAAPSAVSGAAPASARSAATDSGP